jgi:hypothetical protein
VCRFGTFCVGSIWLDEIKTDFEGEKYFNFFINYIDFFFAFYFKKSDGKIKNKEEKERGIFCWGFVLCLIE